MLIRSSLLKEVMLISVTWGELILNTIIENLKEIQDNISLSAQISGLRPEDIKLVAVTKTISVENIAQVVGAGVMTLGENRVQELLEKYDKLPADVEWHIIGHLQTNKVKYIIDKVKLIHSLDRLALAEEINLRGRQNNIIMDTLIQVNVSGEESKYGMRPEEVKDFIEKVQGLTNIRIRGMMTMAPFYTQAEEARWVFRGLRRLRDELLSMEIPNLDLGILSMGMTNDYQVAIEEGANMVRVGSGIFGARR